MCEEPAERAEGYSPWGKQLNYIESICSGGAEGRYRGNKYGEAIRVVEGEKEECACIKATAAFSGGGSAECPARWQRSETSSRSVEECVSFFSLG